MAEGGFNLGISSQIIHSQSWAVSAEITWLFRGQKKHPKAALVCPHAHLCPFGFKDTDFGQQDGLVGKATRPEDPNLIPKTHMVEGGNWFLQIVLWPLCVQCGMPVDAQSVDSIQHKS